MGSVDTKRLSGEVAARHGLLIREDDPAMALVTMSEIVLEQVLSEAELRFRGVLLEAEKGQKRSQQETLVWVQEEMGRAGRRSERKFSAILMPVDYRRESWSSSSVRSTPGRRCVDGLRSELFRVYS